MRPILVTGAHRSGTTWVGKTLAAHEGLGYVHEPFNVELSAKQRDAPTLWFQETSNQDESRRKYLARLLRAVVPRTPVIKDPIALMSADWIHRTFDAHVVVTIRHPAAFVSSIKLLGWTFPWNDFLKQPRLLEKRLAPFIKDIRKFAALRPDSIAEASLLWNVLYHVVRQYQSEHPDWIFLRHEDLSLDPRHGFAALFSKIGLSMTPECERFIQENSVDNTEVSDLTARGNPLGIKRNSKANLFHWRQRLNAEELNRLRASLDNELFHHFYPEPSWSF